MIEFWYFFLILFAALSFTTLFEKLHSPWVLSLILGGFVIGPHGLDLIQIDATVNFFAEIGLVFLMFMVGIEIPISKFKEKEESRTSMILLMTAIPLMMGIFLGRFFDYSWVTSLLIGVIFISSSVTTIIPALESSELINLSIGSFIVTSAMIHDILSLIIFSVVLNIVDPASVIPLPLLIVLIISIFTLGRLVIKKLRITLKSFHKHKADHYEDDLRIIFVILIGTVIAFEFIGIHPIIAGFFSGLVLSDSIKSHLLRQKLHAISYGVFIPFFFIILGANTNIILFASGKELLFPIIFVSIPIIIKFISGYIGGRLSDFGPSESKLIASSTFSILTTALAIAYTGSSLGLIDDKLLSSIILLTIVSTFISPILMDYLIKKHPSKFGLKYYLDEK